MKILVTGGTGFVGSALTKQLLELGHDVTAIGTSRQCRLPGHPHLSYRAADTTLPGPWQQQVAEIKLSAAAVQYVYRLVQATRAPGRFAVGLSPRAGLAVVAAAKAWAFIEGRAHVLPEDIKAVWVAVAAHRVQALQAQSHSADVLTEMLTHVAVG